jgi:hypothetical protein
VPNTAQQTANWQSKLYNHAVIAAYDGTIFQAHGSRTILSIPVASDNVISARMCNSRDSTSCVLCHFMIVQPLEASSCIGTLM